jgi:hypothetical protein
MYAPSPVHVRVYEMQRQELLDQAARYRLARTASPSSSAGAGEVVGSRFKIARSVAAFALAVLSTVAFGLLAK